jgi:hypothetical protein
MICIFYPSKDIVIEIAVEKRWNFGGKLHALSLGNINKAIED